MTNNYWQSCVLTILLGSQIFGLSTVEATANQKRTACQIKKF
ncbi:hypothetical protein MC7420_4409 [Coleofasciculus chthonoplastes PCC 7420]|uniref:Uncharacterized protein n=1 Tax=Coleofasciculus chthonoplastes PCC 7420 TaxID=118168 RepID=B4VXZ5_9CYAN|nr:hypothetical protein [Coleofasciculus chthonoplastes]EDX73162.1 hypothetical protein MC7420_4409 [Coleofasciculus chthonoplastes PCC 7420]